MIEKLDLVSAISSGGGKLPSSVTPVYASSTSMTIEGDWTRSIYVGCPLIIDDNGTLRYTYCAKSIFSSGTTTINISNCGDDTGAAISSLSGGTINNVWVGNGGGLLEHPQWIRYTPSWSGLSVNPGVQFKYMCVGRSITINMDTTVTGTATGATATFSTPTNIFVDNTIQGREFGMVRDATSAFQLGHYNTQSGSTIRFRNVTGGGINNLNGTLIALYGTITFQIEQ